VCWIAAVALFLLVLSPSPPCCLILLLRDSSFFYSLALALGGDQGDVVVVWLAGFCDDFSGGVLAILSS